MRKSRRGSEIAPSLFPFLAVLLCTMGAIVFILILTVAKAGDTARLLVESEVDEEEQAIEDLLYVAIDERAATRDAAVEELESLRQRLQHFESHIQQLRREHDDLLAREKAMAAAQSEDSQHKDANAQIRELMAERDQLQAEIDQKISDAKNRQPAFAIIPYQGRNGTTRRPIYLECLADRLILQPEGIEFSLRDLAPPYHPGGPLDAVLRTIRSHHQQLDETMSSYSAPYPLVLVRPSGIRTFALTRNALQGWDDQFGYELIDEQMPLTFPGSSPGLKPKIETTLASARQRQAALVASIPKNILDPKMIDAWIQQPIGANQLGGASEESHRGSSPLASPGTALGGDWKMIKEFDHRAESGESPANPERVSGIHSHRSTVEGSDSQGDVGLFTGYQNFDNASGSNLGFGQGDGFAAANAGDEAGSGADITGQRQQNPGGSSNGSNSSRSSQGSEHSLHGVASTGEHQGISNGDTKLQNGTSSGQGAPSAGSSGMTMQQPMASDSSDHEKTPSLSFQVGQSQSDRDLQPISVTQGRDWATARSSGRQTPVLRQIQMVVLPDAWIVLSDTNPRRAEVTISLNQGWKRATDELSRAIRERIDSWGIAVAGGYWKPLLRAEVLSPDSPSLRALERALEGSGIQLETLPLQIQSSASGRK